MPFLACTASAVRKVVVSKLSMQGCAYVFKSPDRSNIFYKVRQDTEFVHLGVLLSVRPSAPLQSSTPLHDQDESLSDVSMSVSEESDDRHSLPSFNISQLQSLEDPDTRPATPPLSTPPDPQLVSVSSSTLCH